MDNQEQRFALLQDKAITKTSYRTVSIPQTLITGVKLGTGTCKAVILRLNRYVRNDAGGTEVGIEQVYYGDSSRQEIELLRGEYSQTIFCTNLEEVFLRNPDAAKAIIQAIVYE